jgi:hypothetical protein
VKDTLMLPYTILTEPLGAGEESPESSEATGDK